MTEKEDEHFQGLKKQIDAVVEKQANVNTKMANRIRILEDQSKAGGRKTSDIMKQPVKGAGKRSDAKDDVKFGIRLHGKGRYLSQREINKLMR